MVLQSAEQQHRWKGLFVQFGAMKQRMHAADTLTSCEAVGNAL
jgi:hypothetical protein